MSIFVRELISRMCRYLHDPSKVAVCKSFLENGVCAKELQAAQSGIEGQTSGVCLLSHDRSRALPEIMPGEGV